MGLKLQPRIIVVTRETRLEGLLKRWSTKRQARFVFQNNRAIAAANAGDMSQAVAAQTEEDAEFLELENEDSNYQIAVRQLMHELDFGLPLQSIDRQYLPSIDFELCAVVVVVGQDGLVANTAKYVGDTPIVGVNPDPARIDGVLLPYTLDSARKAVSKALNNQSTVKPVTLAEAELHDGQKLMAFNDFFIGARSHVSARYEIKLGKECEEQSSSGVLVSTGAGSTGWMSSVFNMTMGVARSLGQSISDSAKPKLNWSDDVLLWAVREPFHSKTSGITMVSGRIRKDEELVLESRMSSGGVIFSDGIENDFLEFNGGSIARIRIAKQQARLVVS